jgi:hypothetical protein
MSAVSSMELSNWDIDVKGDLAIVTTDAAWRTEAGKEGALKQLMVFAVPNDGRWVRTKVVYNFDHAR